MGWSWEVGTPRREERPTIITQRHMWRNGNSTLPEVRGLIEEPRVSITSQTFTEKRSGRTVLDSFSRQLALAKAF